MSNIPTIYFSYEDGTRYEFRIYPIEATPSADNAVYMFCCVEDNEYIPVYIGKAEDLPDRLSGHERIDEARDLGATHLLVYASDPKYKDVETWLIAHHNPTLNKHHTT